jgi:hypothetical protein
MPDPASVTDEEREAALFARIDDLLIGLLDGVYV